MENRSRRTFITDLALAGAGSLLLSPLGSKADRPHPPQSKASTLKQGAVILFQGDSITDGNRGRSSDPNHIMGHGYAFSIASRIGADYPEKNYHFINRGISANKIIDLEKRWTTDTLDLKPDILSILIGVNDSASVVTNWDPPVSIEKYREVYSHLLTITREAFPDVLFVLGEPFIAPGSRINDNQTAYLEDIQQRQNIVRQLSAEFNAVFVAYQQVFDQAFKRAPVNYWIWDGVHPTVAGHELMTREWLKEVGKRITF